MSITPPIEALCNCPREDNYDYAPLFKRTFEASEVQEIEDDNTSITRSVSVAQTDNGVLKANCYVDYSFYSSLVKLCKGRQLWLCLVI